MKVKEAEKRVVINGNELKLTNLSKAIWPADGLAKTDLIKYYTDVSEYLLPHLYDRPFVMSRYPDGIEEEFFYQKDCPSYAPDWIKTFNVPSETREDGIHYIICNNLEALLWLANQCCIEMHPWLAKIPNLDCPDIAVFDLDPTPDVEYGEVLKIAMLVKETLNEFDLEGYPKTSGSTGMHIYVPLEPVYTYEQVKNFAHFICKIIHRAYPEMTTLERKVDKRWGVYLDYLQNSRGKTMACHYSLRPHPGAPVSTPLTWDEVKEGKVRPSDFNINNVIERLKEKGDLFKGLLNKKQSLDKINRYIEK